MVCLCWTHYILMQSSKFTLTLIFDNFLARYIVFLLFIFAANRSRLMCIMCIYMSRFSAKANRIILHSGATKHSLRDGQVSACQWRYIKYSKPPSNYWLHHRRQPSKYEVLSKISWLLHCRFHINVFCSLLVMAYLLL